MSDIITGFLQVFQPLALIAIILGVAVGISIGSLPGLTATMGVALILPITFSMDPNVGILMLIGVYIGAIYGGSISAILLRTPGTPAAAATIFDGYPMVTRGEAGRALGLSTVASATGGLVSTVLLISISPQLAKLALNFSSPEFFGLAVFGLSIIVSISGKSVIKGVIVGLAGLLLSTVGIDHITGALRFTFDNVNLYNGFNFIPIMIGLFAMSQALLTVEDIWKDSGELQKVGRIVPTKEDLRKILPTALRSGFIGTLIGIVPGAGAEIGAFVAYNEEKRWSKHPEKLGTGVPEGIAAPEAGNNGVTGGAMIPLLTLGIPGDAVTAILLGALMVQGLTPGPLLFVDHASTVYTIFIGFLVANFAVLGLGLSGAKIFGKVVSIPKPILTPLIFVLCTVGSYAINNNFFDVLVMFIAGVIGYFMEKTGFPVSPAVLALILGPMAESEFRKSLLLSSGDYFVFFTRPISFFFVVAAILTLTFPLLRTLWQMIKGTKPQPDDPLNVLAMDHTEIMEEVVAQAEEAVEEAAEEAADKAQTDSQQER